MKTVDITSLDLVGTSDLLSELDKRGDRVVVLMEKDRPDRAGIDWIFHANKGFKTRERIVFSLMYQVQNIVSECMGDQKHGC